jgi:hypothetical protein
MYNLVMVFVCLGFGYDWPRRIEQSDSTIEFPVLTDQEHHHTVIRRQKQQGAPHDRNCNTSSSISLAVPEIKTLLQADQNSAQPITAEEGGSAISS